MDQDFLFAIFAVQLGLVTPTAGSIVGGIRFSPDGKHLAMTGGPAVKLYALDFSVWEQEAKALLEQAEKAAGLRLEGVTLAQPK